MRFPSPTNSLSHILHPMNAAEDGTLESEVDSIDVYGGGFIAGAIADRIRTNSLLSGMSQDELMAVNDGAGLKAAVNKKRFFGVL